MLKETISEPEDGDVAEQEDMDQQEEEEEDADAGVQEDEQQLYLDACARGAGRGTQVLLRASAHLF